MLISLALPNVNQEVIRKNFDLRKSLKKMLFEI